MRRMGAQHYARRGVPLDFIKFIGRWGSAAVELYVAEALCERAEWAPAVASHIVRVGPLVLGGRALDDLPNARDGGGTNAVTVSAEATSPAGASCARESHGLVKCVERPRRLRPLAPPVLAISCGSFVGPTGAQPQGEVPAFRRTHRTRLRRVPDSPESERDELEES